MITLDVVRELVRETLALRPTDEVRSDQLLFYDLGFTSMDLLDLLFRIEERFAIAIPEGTLYRLARGDLDDAAFAERSILTAVGRERLMALLSDTPPQVFPATIHAATLPRYATVAAIARLVDHQRESR
ncbi:MAG: phosphopantetheine-binding protein [Kofleriaceae bacterium]